MESQIMDHAAITQVLKDVGCGEELIRKFLNLIEKHRIEDGIAFLAKQRAALCIACHLEQKKIDCLDYLVYMIEKENR